MLEEQIKEMAKEYTKQYLSQFKKVAEKAYIDGMLVEVLDDPDYWTRLEHQYAGMAMNALLLTNNIRNGDLEGMRECNTNAMAIAHALVEKYKKEEK